MRRRQHACAAALALCLSYADAVDCVAAGFAPSQFMLVRQTRLRATSSDALLTQVSNFTGLSYHQSVLRDKTTELNVHCEAPRRKTEPAARASSRGATEADPVSSRPLVNTHSEYTGNNAVRRSYMSAGTLAELTRLANAHTELLDGLGLQEFV